MDENPFLDDDPEPSRITVALVADKAYWVQDMTFMESDLDDDGDPDRETARPLDVFSLPFPEVTKMLIVLDNLVRKS